MIRQAFSTWPREAYFWVPLTFLACVCVALYACAAAVAYIGISFSQETKSVLADSARQVFHWSCIAAALGFALHRVVRFHPFCDLEYAQWLSRTPYDGTQRLPKGPAQLAFPDLTFIMPLVLASVLGFGDYWAYPTMVFLLVYSAMQALCFSSAGDRVPAASLGTIFPSIVYSFLPWPNFALAASVVLLCVTEFRGRRLLRAFQWDATGMAEIMVGSQLMADIHPARGAKPPRSECPQSNGGLDIAAVGWPLAGLAPCRPIPKRRIRDSIVVALICAMNATCFIMLFAASTSPAFHGSGKGSRDAALELVFLNDFAGPWAMILGLGMSTAAAWRAFQFVGGYAPPSSFRARLFGGLWKDWSYFRVFAGPVVSVVLPPTLFYAGFKMTGSFLVWSLVSIFIWYLLLRHAGPDMERWVLTGRHRLRLLALAKMAAQDR